MTYVIICKGLAGHTVVPPHMAPVGAYLESYDPEAKLGRGEATWTRELEKAQRFESIIDAHSTWTTVPKMRRVRADGRPNRPLTAFTIEVAPTED